MIISDDTLILDGFDDCLEGICIRFGQEPIAIYNYDKIIKKLILDGATEEEAEEWFNFNIIGAWVGDLTPAFLVKDFFLESA